MKLELIQAYIAKKVAIRYQEFAFARATMSLADYHALVMNKKAKTFDAEFLENLKNIITHRYKIKEHKTMFKNPTLSQWISDITGTWQQHDVLAFFAERSGISTERLKKSNTGDCTLYRGLFIDLVEELENITGKTLGDNSDSIDPYAYLGDDILYTEISSFFGASGVAPNIEQKRQTLA